MPKAIFEFSLPEEQDEFENMRQGAEALYVLRSFYNDLRGKIKYPPSTQSQETAEMLDDLMNMLISYANDRKIDLI